MALGAKEQARHHVIAGLLSEGWDDCIRTVRVNSWATPWTHVDVIEIVAGAGARLDAIVLPKVEHPSHVHALDLLLTQLEALHQLEPGGIGIEAQIESASALRHINDIAAASPRLQSLVLGPADLMANLGIRSLRVGEQPDGYAPGDAYHHALMTILVAARAHGLQAIDGPYVDVADLEGFRRSAGRTAALGYDGKWVIHPSQIEAGNGIFQPTQEQFDAAERLLEAYHVSTSTDGGLRGAVRYGGEMIDEASRALAESIAAKGRRAGMRRQG
ncbi:CoA ester lyase [Hoyosella rhizosphaerae]|uniref:CoA ester lyase n=1 Tax=Hoyosella rhizosphaerae TaxID=1755582 RepID=A0A916UEI7_9ACTN|nr:CoA ester lyase [Hoyosella rhizosphaerae]